MDDELVLQFLNFTKVDERWKDLILGTANLMRRVKEALPELDWREYVEDKELAENLLVVLKFFEMNAITKRLQAAFISDDELMAALATVVKEPMWQGIVGREKAQNLLYVVQFFDLNNVSKPWQDSVIHNAAYDTLRATLAAILVKEPKWREPVGAERAEDLLHIIYFCEGNKVKKECLYSIISNNALMATAATSIKKPNYQDIVGAKKAEDLLLSVTFCECNKLSADWLDWIIGHADVMAALASVSKKQEWVGIIGKKKATDLLLVLNFLRYTDEITRWLPIILENGTLMVRFAAATEEWRRKDEIRMKQNAKKIMNTLQFFVLNGVAQRWQDLILHNPDSALSLGRVLDKHDLQGNVGATKAENIVHVVHFCTCNSISKSWLDCIIKRDDVLATLANAFTKPQWQGIVEKERIANLTLMVDFLYRSEDLGKWLRLLLEDDDLMVKVAALMRKLRDKERIGLSMNAENFLLALHFLEFNKVKEGWQNLILCSLDLVGSLATILKTLSWDDFMSDENANYLPNCLPDARSIFKAFSYAEPDAIKALIIGQFPLTDRNLTSGLAFSANCCKKGFLYSTGSHILAVHKSLKIAGLLKQDYRYDFSHEDWARNGVLLLNLALTITERRGNDISEVNKHFDIWNEFWKDFVADWIAKRKSDNTLFVMCWGSSSTAVWGEVLRQKATFGKHKKLLTLRSDHPTRPGDQGNFLNETPQHFQMINECYPGIFNILKRKTIANNEDK